MWTHRAVCVLRLRATWLCEDTIFFPSPFCLPIIKHPNTVNSHQAQLDIVKLVFVFCFLFFWLRWVFTVASLCRGAWAIGARASVFVLSHFFLYFLISI